MAAAPAGTPGADIRWAGGPITELARPKVNLTLRVTGRRADGYHEIESLVVFAADVADTVTLAPGDATPKAAARGPFAGGIAGENLIDVTLERIRRAAPHVKLGAVTLDKRLPVAAGIGGGSADAAAVLRAVCTLNSNHVAEVDWESLAASLGADVPVCVASSAHVMRGIGQRLEPMPGLPVLAAVLVNPRVPVPADKTAQVFRALKAPALAHPPPDRFTPSTFEARAEVIAHMREVGNDLLKPARTIVPEITAVLEALAGDPACEIAQLSGGGPTCFGIYAGMDAAHRAACEIEDAHPSWWVVATRLG